MLPDEVKGKLKAEAINASLAKLQNDVSLRVDEFIGKNMFTEAEALIKKESQTPISKRIKRMGGDPLSEINSRLLLAHETFVKKHVKSLIQSGKYEEALKFCDGQSTLRRRHLIKIEIVDAAVKELGDGRRLVQLYDLIDDVNLQGDVVLKLAQLKTLSLLSQEKLVKIVNASDRDDVVQSAVAMIGDKNALISLLDKQCNAEVFKSIFVKISDSAPIRDKVWLSDNDDRKMAYIAVFGSDEECLKLVKDYPNALTDKVISALMLKASQIETKSTLKEVCLSRFAREIASLGGAEIVDRVKSIKDENIRSGMAARVIKQMRASKPSWDFLHGLKWVECYRDEPDKLEKEKDLVAYMELVDLVSRSDLKELSEEVKANAGRRINFEGFYVGMSVADYLIITKWTGCKPEVIDLFGVYLIKLSRSDRFKLFEKEDGEFWPAFMRTYIPKSTKKKSIGESIDDALDSGSYDYQEAYDSSLEERCYIYKSMKYQTKVVFGLRSGRLVLEKYN